jgi:hypothetical protein
MKLKVKTMMNNKPKATAALQRKTKGSSSVSQFTPSINNIRGVATPLKARKLNQIEKIPTKFPKPMQVKALKTRMPQYGDKKYKPSDGTGVGY